MENKRSNQYKLTIALFSAYSIILVWVIIFKTQFSVGDLPQYRGLNLIPFAGSAVKNNQLDFSEIFSNILVFIPFGLYWSMIKKNWAFGKKIMLIAGVSLFFELIQYVFAIGGADVTDLISNTLGGVLGIGLYAALSRLLKENTNKVLNILALVATVCVVLLVLFVVLFFTH
jgi:glycopeptide antibiotics resistance protein